MSQELIRLTDLVMEFDGERILDSINLYIKDKEFLTLLGPSGCGKTTTLRVIGGFLTPTSGDVLFDGKRINDVPAYQRRINTVFQRYALFPHLDVYDNIAFGLRIAKHPEQEIDERVTEMLEIVSLKGFENRKVTSLSGGQQQRVAIARALINRPKVLLLDEPLGALDLRLRKDMQNELKRIQQAMGITFIYVTHDQEEALTMSDQIILLHDGQIEQQGDPFTIYSQPASVFASDFLGKANLLSGTLACEDGMWYVCSENVRIPVNHVGGREGDTVKAAVRGEYFEFCSPETEGANPFHLEKKIFTGLSWKLIGTLGAQPLDISALGTHAGTLSEGDDLFVRIRPENVVYYNNN